MAKELPYFKFFISEWITGDITICDMETQGVFINICSYYWSKNGSICLANVKQRFSNNIANVEQLIFMKIIKLDEDDNIIINFLDEQMNEFIDVSEKRAKAGSKGGKANAKQKLSKAKAKTSNKEKIREDKYNIIHFDNSDINKLFIEYLQLRNKMKLSNSETVITRLKNKLREYSDNKTDTAKEIIMKAITSKWKDFYSLNK